VQAAITKLQIHINETGMTQIWILLQPIASDVHQVPARVAFFTGLQSTSTRGIIHHAIKHVWLFCM
jgi:hypothetical protein